MPPYWQLTVPLPESISEGLTNFVWELGALGVVEDEVLRAFFPPDAIPGSLDARVREYLDGLRALGYAVNDVAPVVTPVADQAWAEAWKEHFRPVEVGSRLLVAPPWNTPATPRLMIVIEPGRAFGTGHHGSTAGCMVLLERLCERPRDGRAPGRTGRLLPCPIQRALDLGTGSGILAIAAARLGILEVLAVDTDPDAIAAAVANATRNGVPDRVHCAILDAEAVRASAFPLVIANLLAQAHLRLAARYRAMVAPHGALILGGILEGEASELVGALEASGFRERERRVLDGWASLLLRRV